MVIKQQFLVSPDGKKTPYQASSMADYTVERLDLLADMAMNITDTEEIIALIRDEARLVNNFSQKLKESEEDIYI